MSRIEPDINIADVKSHETWLRSLAWRILRNPDDVDDVVQDVWLANLRRSEPRSPSRAWLSSVTRNLSVTRLRRKTQRLDVEREAAREEELGENVQSAIESVCLYKRLVRWILELEEPYRETLLLRFARDLKLREVARLMDVPESTVRVRARRGLVLLRKKARSEFSEERRKQLVLILFGVAEAERALPGVVAVAAVVATLAIPFGLWRILDRDEEVTTRHLGPAAVEPQRPRMARRARIIPVVSDDIVEPERAGAAAEIRGRIEFRRGGILHECRLDIEAVPFMVGNAMALPAMRPNPSPFAGGWEATHRTRVENGRPFRIPVAEPGRYRLMISIEGVMGALQFWSGTKHWTDADQMPHSTFDLLDGIEIVHGSGRHGRSEIAWRHRDGAQREELRFESGVARVDGLFMPRMRLRWTDLRNDQTWVREINDSVTAVRLPELSRSSAFVIRSAGGNEPVRDARVAVAFYPRDNQPWESSVAVPSPRHPELYLPEATSARRLEVTVSGAGLEPRLFDITSGSLPASVELLPRQSVSGVVIHPSGGGFGAVTVVAVENRIPRLAGTVSPDGSFVLEPVAAPRPEATPIEGRKLAFWLLGDGFCGRVEAAPESGRVLLRPPPEKTFELIVRDSDLEPVSGAKLIRVPWNDQALGRLMMGDRITSDDDGRVAFAVCGGKWMVDVRAPGFSPRRFVLDSQADAREPVTIRLTRAPEPRGNLIVLRPDGKPLPYAFVSLMRQPGGPPLELRTDGRGEANLAGLEVDAVPFDVTYPGYTLSLSSPTRTSRGAEDMTVVLARVVEVPCTVLFRGEGPVWVRCSAIGRPHGRKRLFRFRSGAPLPLTDEDQRVEFLRPGHAPHSIDVTDRRGSLTVGLTAGPRVEIADCEVGDRITLVPELEPGLVEHAAELRSDFTLEKVAKAAVVEWSEITPGVYRLEWRPATGGRLRSRRLVITGDLTISREQLF